MSDKPDTKLSKLQKAHANIGICRDFFAGAVKVMRGEKYLPKWSGELDEGYKTRLASTPFPNLFAPIASGISGLVTKKEAAAESLDDLDLSNVDGKGTSLTTFVKQVCESSIIAGIEFVAVETSQERQQVFLKRYKYEDLMSYIMEDGELTQIVFRDKVERAKGIFDIEEAEQYIVFRVGSGEIWYEVEGGSGLAKQDEWQNSLDAIPVVAIRTGKELSTFEVVPKFYDVAKLNQVVLNLESQLANVLSIVGNPVPIFWGNVEGNTQDEDGVTKMQIGVKDALVFNDKSKDGFEYAEIEGKGVDKLTAKIDEIKQTIDREGFSLLRQKGNKTVIDAQQEQTKNTSALTDIADELETKFNRLIRWMAQLGGRNLPEEARLVFKKDFDDVLFSDQQLKLLYDLVVSGELSRQTFWDKLKVANVLPKDFDAGEEQERISSQT